MVGLDPASRRVPATAPVSLVVSKVNVNAVLVTSGVTLAEPELSVHRHAVGSPKASDGLAAGGVDRGDREGMHGAVGRPRGRRRAAGGDGLPRDDGVSVTAVDG